MSLNYVRVAGESTPGNETNSTVLATKNTFLPTLGFEVDPGFKHMTRDEEARGVDEALPVVTEAADPSWSDTNRGYPDVLGTIFTHAFGLPTTTAGNGIITDPDAATIPATAYRHVWVAPGSPAGPTPYTFQADMAYKDTSNFFKVRGAATSQITIDSPAEGGVMVKRSGPALFLDTQADPAFSATTEALDIPPFERAFLTLPTWLASTADFEDFTLQFDIPLKPVHTAGSGSRWPDKMFKGDTPILVTGSVPKTLIASADYAALKAATAFAVKAKWQSSKNILATAYPYRLWVESASAQYTDGGPNGLTNERRIGAKFGFRFGRSVGGGASWTITLVNSTASYT